MRFTYYLTMGDFKCECADVDGVVKTVNGKAGFPVVTDAMIYSLFTRPHRANKRICKPDYIKIQRQRLPTKAERHALATCQGESTSHP